MTADTEAAVSGGLAAQIDAAKAELARLEQLAKDATCRELVRHDMQSVGGVNCGCHEYAACSVPVHECTRCGVSDYGKNEDADEQRRSCLWRDEGVTHG